MEMAFEIIGLNFTAYFVRKRLGLRAPATVLYENKQAGLIVSLERPP